MTSLKRHHQFDFYEIHIQICKEHMYAVYQISILSDISKLRYTVGKLTENYEEKIDIESP